MLRKWKVCTWADQSIKTLQDISLNHLTISQKKLDPCPGWPRGSAGGGGEAGEAGYHCAGAAPHPVPSRPPPGGLSCCGSGGHYAAAAPGANCPPRRPGCYSTGAPPVSTAGAHRPHSLSPLVRAIAPHPGAWWACAGRGGYFCGCYSSAAWRDAPPWPWSRRAGGCTWAGGRAGQAVGEVRVQQDEGAWGGWGARDAPRGPCCPGAVGTATGCAEKGNTR